MRRYPFATAQRLKQTKFDVGMELSPAWQAEYKKRCDSIAEKLLAAEAELTDLQDFEDLAAQQGVEISRFGRSALQHLRHLGPYSDLTVSGWVSAIRENTKYL